MVHIRPYPAEPPQPADPDSPPSSRLARALLEASELRRERKPEAPDGSSAGRSAEAILDSPGVATKSGGLIRGGFLDAAGQGCDEDVVSLDPDFERRDALEPVAELHGSAAKIEAPAVPGTRDRA